MVEGVEFEECVQLTRYFFRQKERSDSDLQIELSQAQEVLLALVKVPLQKYQEQALLCLFADVLGDYVMVPQIEMSQWFLVKALNQDMFQIAAAEFSNFCCTNGKVSLRLVKKRQCEQNLFLTGELQFSR